MAKNKYKVFKPDECFKRKTGQAAMENYEMDKTLKKNQCKLEDTKLQRQPESKLTLENEKKELCRTKFDDKIYGGCDGCEDHELSSASVSTSDLCFPKLPKFENKSSCKKHNLGKRCAITKAKRQQNKSAKEANFTLFQVAKDEKRVRQHARSIGGVSEKLRKKSNQTLEDLQGICTTLKKQGDVVNEKIECLRDAQKDVENYTCKVKEAQADLERSYKQMELAKEYVEKEKREMDRIKMQEKKIRCHAKKELFASKKACRYAEAWTERAEAMEEMYKQLESYRNNVESRNMVDINKRCNLNIKVDVSDVDIPCCKRPEISPIPRLNKFCDRSGMKCNEIKQKTGRQKGNTQYSQKKCKAFY